MNEPEMPSLQQIAKQTPSVCAVLVTRDRPGLLQDGLRALQAQTRPVDRIVVVDNASAAPTQGVLAAFPGIEVIRLETNGGGAGGFHAGMLAAQPYGHDWLWLMDDDTIPSPDALQRLLEALQIPDIPSPDLLASRVLWTDGRLHPKNLPLARTGDAETFIAAASKGLLAIRLASFVSILVSRRAIERHGLPHPHFFIWGDDGEYTARILKHSTGYTVPSSVVEHRTPGLEPVHHDTSGRYFYEVRNKLLQMRGSSFTAPEKVHLLVGTLMGIVIYLRHNRWRPRALLTVARGTWRGLLDPTTSS
jgi:GT2 family glycosyltransferase